MSIPSVLHVLGRLCLLLAGLLLVPLVLVAFEGDWSGVGRGFLVASATSAALGLLLVLAFHLDRDAFDAEEAFCVVTCAWLVFGALGALPYVMSGRIEGVVDAVFEALSGFTTTGASVLSDPAALGGPLLFWRALTHWIGGMGIVVLSIAILPALDAGGNFLFRAETTGLFRQRVHPRIQDTSRTLWGVYLGLTVLSICALWIAGMSPFDAACHAFATVATGGFGTRGDSLASFPPAVQWVTVGLMVLAGLNYVMLLRSLTGRPATLLRSTEARTWIVVLVLASAVGVLAHAGEGDAPGAAEPLVRGIVFNVVSVGSTTGFANDDFGAWPVPLQAVLLLLMVGGACSGSTSGSAKIGRHVIWAKAAWRELQRLLRPTAVFAVKVDGQVVPEGVVTRSVSFLLFYLGATCLGTLLLALLGLGGVESLSGMVTTLSGVGPGLGELGPTRTFAEVPDGGKMILMGAMLLGRLEFFAILTLLSPLAWRR